MWGPRMAECVTGADLLDPSQVVVTGCPRFDLYHPDWQSVLSESAPGTTPRILINTNFSGINPRFATVEQIGVSSQTGSAGRRIGSHGTSRLSARASRA